MGVLPAAMSIIASFVFCLASGIDESCDIIVSDFEDTLAHAHLGDGETDELFNELVSIEDKETFIDNTYASYYFANLNKNFGNNVYGSCGYVSVGMILSFYDAYWDDAFIDDSYDVGSIYSASKQNGADFYLIPSDSESPGIRFEPTSLSEEAADANEYLEVASRYSDTYFQFKLFELAQKYFGSIEFDDSRGGLGLNGEGIFDFLDYYLHEYKGFSKSETILNLCGSSDQSSIQALIASEIKAGRPAIIIAKKAGTASAHSMIAYDYDSSSEEIYVHTGWRDEETDTSLTHIALSDLGYTDIVSAVILNVKSSQNLGTKYFSESGDGSYSSAFIFPRELKLASGNYADMNPTFVWQSLYSEKWVSDYQPFINFSILDFEGNSIFEVTNIYGNSYTLTTTQWANVRFGIKGEQYYALVSLGSDSYSYWDEYWCKAQFTKPNVYKNKPYILPNEYGFEDSYPTDEGTREQFITHSVRGFVFETRRYRVGYIHNEDIVMSSIREGINEAYIEYRFKTALTRIDVALSYWREQSKEWLTSSNGVAVVEQYIDDGWSSVFDLLSSETALPEDRNNKNTYKIEFSQPTYRIRFHSVYNGAASSDRNRGRICIGSMAFYESDYNLPLSGGELDYDPNSWNSTVVSEFLWVRHYLREYTNCYSYAVNAQVNPTSGSLEFMQPGQTSGVNIKPSDVLDTDYLISLISDDANTLGFLFESVEACDVCPNGTYKVALVVDNELPGYDYHWYRQNADGSWSHKPGSTSVVKNDASGEIILDPRYCDRDCGDGLNYNLFVGFFAVKPLNITY